MVRKLSLELLERELRNLTKEAEKELDKIVATHKAGKLVNKELARKRVRKAFMNIFNEMERKREWFCTNQTQKFFHWIDRGLYDKL